MQTKSLNDLRTILSEEIDKVRTGTTSAANVNAVTNATGKILSSIKLEMEYYKLLGKVPDIDFLKQLEPKKDNTNPNK